MNDFHMHWAISILNNNGYQLDPIPEKILQTPWSEVYRFKTNKGFIYFKKVPPALSIEPKVIHVLLKEFQARVPHVIAVNDELQCFLMSDAGVTLHDYFKNNFQEDILINTMRDYAEFQIKTAKKIDLFINIGVPDWQLEKLPKLYQSLVENEVLLLNDGLSREELIQLKELAPKLLWICEKLSDYKIKDTFGHADFHDKNILVNIDTRQTTIIDLGEVVITHPFFSFLNCLHRATKNFSLSNQQYRQLQRAYFKPWLAFETEEDLFEILGLIQQCWSIHAVLGEFRLMMSVDPSAYLGLHRQGRFSENLRYWINQ